MSLLKDTQSESPVFSTKRAKGLLKLPERVSREMNRTKNSDIFDTLETLAEEIKSGSFRNMSAWLVPQISNYIEKVLIEKNSLSSESKYLIKTLLAFSFANNNIVIKSCEESLMKIIGKLVQFENKDDLNWLFETLVSYLSKSQKSKLQEAYLSESTDDSLIESGGKYLLTLKLIKLFYSHVRMMHMVNMDSPGFLNLDNSAKEAVCWKELEFSRSKNPDFARLAGTIAWRNWLFKEPLLKAYCKQNDLDFKQLNFGQKADLTKKILTQFSQEEMAQILDEATSVELERRKAVLKTETNPKLINRRVSVGIELEVKTPPFELAVIYAWFENLDRSLANDSIAFNSEIDKLFQQIIKIKILMEDILDYTHASSAIGEISEGYEKRIYVGKQEELKEKVNLLISIIPEQQFANGLHAWLIENKVNLEVLELIKKYFEKILIIVRGKLELEKRNFIFPLTETNNTDPKYNVQAIIGSTLRADLPDISHVLLDIFKHHMGQSQMLGHGIGGDAFGEYALAYTSGNFKKPYSAHLRETWELAKTAFHSLETKKRPMHATIGWKEDSKNRELLIQEEIVKQESSLLHFALFCTGWMNREDILEFRDINRLKQAEGRRNATVEQYKDTGRGYLIRTRSDEDGLYGVEFRGLSPAGGMDQARLFEAFGDLGTAMKAYIFVESRKLNSLGKIDSIDLKLHRIWKKFKEKVKKIHEQYNDFPNLYDADSWKSYTHSHTLTNLFLVLSEDLDDEKGLVASMRNLIKETTEEINTYLDRQK